MCSRWICCTHLIVREVNGTSSLPLLPCEPESLYPIHNERARERVHERKEIETRRQIGISCIRIGIQCNERTTTSRTHTATAIHRAQHTEYHHSKHSIRVQFIVAIKTTNFVAQYAPACYFAVIAHFSRAARCLRYVTNKTRASRTRIHPSAIHNSCVHVYSGYKSPHTIKGECVCAWFVCIRWQEPLCSHFPKAMAKSGWTTGHECMYLCACAFPLQASTVYEWACICRTVFTYLKKVRFSCISVDCSN